MLRGWKFVGLSATIILYVLGILVLSIVNLQTPRSERRGKNSRFGVDVSKHYICADKGLQWHASLHSMAVEAT